MESKMLYGLLHDLIDGIKYECIYVKDGDGEFHMVNSIDIFDDKISCNDGWFQYFNAFEKDGNCELFVD